MKATKATNRTVLLLIAAATAAFAQTRSVTEGVYSQQQADRGHDAYYQNCAFCHGAALTGGEAAPPLAGRDFLSNWYGATVNDLFERIRTTMPPENRGMVSREMDADIVAFILRFNRFPAVSASADLAPAAETLKRRQCRIRGNSRRDACG